MTHDLISDMLTRLRNAALVRHRIVLVPFTKINLSILKVLKEEGYLQDIFIQINQKKFITVNLKYKGWWIKQPLFSTLKRVSKSGQRIFSGYKNFSFNFQPLKHSQGIAIISTSSGIMTHLKAKKLKKGGEILCFIS